MLLSPCDAEYENQLPHAFSCVEIVILQFCMLVILMREDISSTYIY